MSLSCTVPARLSFAHANRWAQRFQSASIQPHHLLLGLSMFDAGVGQQALAAFGAHHFKVRFESEKVIGAPVVLHVAPTKLPMSPGSQRALSGATELARNSRDQFNVFTGDCLLGLIVIDDPTVAAILRNSGLSLDRLREETEVGAAENDEEWSSPLWAHPRK